MNIINQTIINYNSYIGVAGLKSWMAQNILECEKSCCSLQFKVNMIWEQTEIDEAKLSFPEWNISFADDIWNFEKII